MDIEIGRNRSFVALDGTIQIMGPKVKGQMREEVARITFGSLTDCLELLSQVAWCADFINQEGTK